MTQFLYQLDFILRPDSVASFEKYFGMVIHAHRQHLKGKKDTMHFTRTFLGGNDIITLTIPMESLNEIETWGHTPGLVLEYYGQEQGMEILNNYCKAVKSWESRVSKPYEIITPSI